MFARRRDKKKRKGNEDLAGVRDPFDKLEVPARTLEELDLMDLTGPIKDKPQWFIKARSPEIMARWQEEMKQQVCGPSLSARSSSCRLRWPRVGEEAVLPDNGSAIACCQGGSYDQRLFAMSEIEWLRHAVTGGCVAPTAVDGVYASDSSLTDQLTADIKVRTGPASWISPLRLPSQAKS
jgi:hypothetical protein